MPDKRSQFFSSLRLGAQSECDDGDELIQNAKHQLKYMMEYKWSSESKLHAGKFVRINSSLRPMEVQRSMASTCVIIGGGEAERENSLFLFL